MPPMYRGIPWRLDGFNKISCNSYATQLQASTQATGSSRCRLLIAPDIRNLIFDPFGPVLDLTYTTKE